LRTCSYTNICDKCRERVSGIGVDEVINCWKVKEKKKLHIFPVLVGELPFKGVKGIVELYSMLKDGIRLERPAQCSEEL